MATCCGWMRGPERSTCSSTRPHGACATPRQRTFPLTALAWGASCLRCSATSPPPRMPVAVSSTRTCRSAPRTTGSRAHGARHVTEGNRMTLLESVLHASPVIPVVVLDDARHAVALARALVAGGVPAIEVTLRTRAALDAVRAIAAEVEGAIVGVGTVRRPQDLLDAEKAGARFAVLPGSTPALIAAAKESPLPWLPGAATASEVMALAEESFVYQKFLDRK